MWLFRRASTTADSTPTAPLTPAPPATKYDLIRASGFNMARIFGSERTQLASQPETVLQLPYVMPLPLDRLSAGRRYIFIHVNRHAKLTPTREVSEYVWTYRYYQGIYASYKSHGDKITELCFQSERKWDDVRNEWTVDIMPTTIVIPADTIEFQNGLSVWVSHSSGEIGNGLLPFM